MTLPRCSSFVLYILGGWIISGPAFFGESVKNVVLRFARVRPVSINESNEINTKKVIVYKSKEFKRFRSEINSLMIMYKSKLKAFERQFDSSKDAISATYIFYFPKEKIINLDATIKKRRFDIDNEFKGLNDIVFKYVPSLDDSFIFHLHGIKAMSPDDDFHIEMSLNKVSQKSIIDMYR